jgi:hypothetical protein
LGKFFGGVNRASTSADTIVLRGELAFWRVTVDVILRKNSWGRKRPDRVRLISLEKEAAEGAPTIERKAPSDILAPNLNVAREYLDAWPSTSIVFDQSGNPARSGGRKAQQALLAFKGWLPSIEHSNTPHLTQPVRLSVDQSLLMSSPTKYFSRCCD